MRRLIESLMPDTRQIYWGLVGGVFAFYVVLMVTAAGVFINHELTRKLVHENAATVASEAKRADFEPAVEVAAAVGGIKLIAPRRSFR